MLNESYHLYEISPLTMAVIPEDDEKGTTSTVILEETGSYQVPSTPTRLIDLACRYFGSSLQGRQEGTREVSRITHKAPIAIDPSSGMFFFPTTSPKNRKCSWINHSHVDDIKPIGTKQTKIIFTTGQHIIVDISYGSMMNQLQRTAQFRFLLENRMKQIRQEMEKEMPQQSEQV